MTRKFTAYTTIMSVLMLYTLTGCKDEPDHPDEGLAICQNIVTYLGDSNGQSVFGYQQIDDSPLVKLTINGRIDSNKAPVGTRLLMTYTLPPGVAYGTDATVDATSLQLIYQGKANLEPTEIPDMAATPGIYVMTLYRSGTYVNLLCRLPVTDGDRSFALVADPATTNTPIPDLYLTTSATTAGGFDRKVVGSFDMSEVWNSTGCQGVRVHVNNTNNIYQQTFLLTK